MSGVIVEAEDSRCIIVEETGGRRRKAVEWTHWLVLAVISHHFQSLSISRR